MRKTAGYVLICIGSIFLIFGAILLWDAKMGEEHYYPMPNRPYEDEAFEILLEGFCGLGGVFVGILLLLIGLTLTLDKKS